MAIRIRNVNGVTVALCAAKTKAEKDDIYLNDNIHHALTTKFGLDFYSEGFLNDPMADSILVDITKKIEKE
jgi:hypothetical protein